jgi:hypothetical protein
MNVIDLIRELQALPNQHAPVRVVTAAVLIGSESEPYHEPLSDEDATEADEVRHMGPWVLIRGR